MIREVQRHPLKHNLIHTDFVTVDLHKEITVAIEVVLTGKPAGLAKGGILTPGHREIEVRCLPKDVVDTIEVDVSHLDVHESLHVADVKLPAGLKAVYTDNYTIASVTTVAIEETPVVAAAPAEGAAATAEGAAAAPAAGGKAAAGAKPAPGAAPAAGAKPAAGAAAAPAAKAGGEKKK